MQHLYEENLKYYKAYKRGHEQIKRDNMLLNRNAQHHK